MKYSILISGSVANKMSILELELRKLLITFYLFLRERVTDQSMQIHVVRVMRVAVISLRMRNYN